MAIRKSDDITNDPNINSRLKTNAAKDDILERFDATKLDNILPCDDGLSYLSEKVDQCIDSINPNILKVGISDDQASAITRNTSKTGITDAQTSAITANTAKNTNVVQTSVTGNAGTATKIASITNDNIVQLAGNQTLTGTKTFSATIVGSVNGNSATTSETTITSGQASAITANTAKTGITSGQASAITDNTAKTGISSSQASAITANTSKTGITSGQASAIVANTAKTVLVIGTGAGNAKAGNTTTISSGQASAITANTSKTGITSGQASAITANTAKVGTETTLSTTEGLTLRATVTENRGTYTLRFTMVTEDGRTTKTADVIMR